MARFCPDCGKERNLGDTECDGCGHYFMQGGEALPTNDAKSAIRATSTDTAESSSPLASGPPDQGPQKSKRRFLIGAGSLAAIALGGALWQMGVISAYWSQGSFSAPAAAPIDMELMPVAFGDRCGYVNSEGRMVINPQFDNGQFFRADTGLAPVSMGRNWGLIDSAGQFTVNPQFDYLEPIAGTDRFIAISGDRAGIIDRRGAFVVNPQFDFISKFDAGGRALVETGGRAGIIDLQGEFVVPPQFEAINWLAENLEEPAGFVDGLVAAKSGGRWGFINDEGAWVIHPQFGETRRFRNGLAAVKFGSDTPQSSAPGSVMTMGPAEPLAPDWGYVDRAGRMVIPHQYEAAGDFAENGLAAVRTGGQWGYIDREGRFRINPQFNTAERFESVLGNWVANISIQVAANSEGLPAWPRGTINEAGAFLIRPQFELMFQFDQRGRAVVKVGNNYGLIDTSGRLIVNLKPNRCKSR